MKLGTRLLRDGVIGLSELEAALRAQVLYGGRLGTNLVELGFLDVDTVGHFLALATGAPEATKERFEQAPPDTVARFGAELAEAETAFPLGRHLTDGGKPAAAVAVLDPGDHEKRARIAAVLGEPVVLYAAAEMRLFFYLEKHYGIERQVRYVRTKSPPREQGQIERRRVLGAPRMLIEPRSKRKKTGRITAVIDPPEPAPRPQPAPADPLAATMPAVSLMRRDVAEIDDVIAGATHRDHIGDALLSAAADRLDALVLLLIRDRAATGWRGFSSTPRDLSGIDQLAVPLGELTTLKLAYDANEIYWGPPPDRASAGETRLWATVGLEIPERALVIPIAVRDRVVNLMAAAGDIDQVTRGELAALGAAASEAYLRMIRDLKKGG